MTNANLRPPNPLLVVSILLALAFSQRFLAGQELPLLATAISTPLVSPDIDSATLLESEKDRGSLLLCGGGTLPRSVLELFHRHGKGSEGKLVIIPTASALADTGDYSRFIGYWADFEWGKIEILHAFDREQAEVTDFSGSLGSATAVWMSGGDQRRLAERYQGTTVEAEIRNVMKRGGVVGGTSAGSAIASRVMISGGQTQPQISSGLDLLPNSIIDQHFSQRLRFERLASAVAAHPERIGIGIDESTGLLVDKKRAQVVGEGAVYVYANFQRPVRVVRTNREDSDSEKEIDSAVKTAEFRTLRVAPGEALESDGFPLLAPTSAAEPE